MDIVYLKDGSQAKLIAKTDNVYIVDRLMVYEEEGETYTEPSGRVEIVDKVYNNEPVEKINEEFKLIASKVEEHEKVLREKRSELSSLEYKIKNTKTDLSRYIVNREELRLAKRLVVFEKDSIEPKILDGLRSRKFTVSYEISQYAGEEKCWSYKLYSDDRDGRYSSSQYFDAEYGIMVDLTDEQIKEKTLERQIKRGIKGFNSYSICATSDEWLTPEFIAEKKRQKEADQKKALEKAEKCLKDAQADYDLITGKIVHNNSGSDIPYLKRSHKPAG